MQRTVLIAATLAVAACSADIQVAEREQEVLDNNKSVSTGTATYAAALKYGTELSRAYLEEAAGFARNRDRGFAAVLAIGTFAGYRAVDGAGTTELAKTAVFGAATNQGLQYANPGRAAKATVKAANRATCVVNVGSIYQTDIAPVSGLEVQATQILVTTLETIRIALRQEITEGTADYSTIATAISQAAEQAATGPKASPSDRATDISLRSAAATRRVAQESFAKLKKEAPICATKN